MTSAGVWSSIRHFRRNAGTFATLRLLVVSGLLFGLAVFVGIREHEPAPMLVSAGDGAIPMLSRERSIERLAASIPGGRGSSASCSSSGWP